MNASDGGRFYAIVGALCESFARAASEGLVLGYRLGVSDLPIEAIELAAARAIRECRFMPTPAELRELAGEVPVASRAVLAWAAVERASAIGSYRAVNFDDPVTNATIRSLGGWPEILSKSESDFATWVRKDFLRTYESLHRAGVDGDACAALPGLSDIGDARMVCVGLPSPSPAYTRRISQ